MPTPFTQADAAALLISLLRRPTPLGDLSSYGYDVYLPSLVGTYLINRGIVNQHQRDNQMRGMMSMLYAAAWDLCRRGILRPGVREYQTQATLDGASGNGYSITPFGRQWLAEANRDDFVPTEPERFAQMLARYRERFGMAFQERAQEAIRCYGAHAYLACCAMCGAAAESVLLATAVAKTSDEVRVLSQYNTNGGRRRVENTILGTVRKELREACTGYMTLLKYWRDQAAHGGASGVDDNEAYTSLALLLRLAFFVDENWDELTASHDTITVA
ncbi:MAG: hypothetical protein ACLQU2_08225 [Candidatus Binataceae bacterium]